MRFFKKKNSRFLPQKPMVKKDNYFHILHKLKNGKTSSFKVHKSIPVIISSILILLIGLIGAISYAYVNLNGSLIEMRRTNYASHNLKGEVEALTLKIKNIQITMNQVENLSSKIKKASTRFDDRKQEANNQNINTSDSLGIGPLSKEDYELSKQLTGIKKDQLQLKTLFEEVDLSEAESSKKLGDFQKLMVELKQHNIKLHHIPDLAPTKGRLSSTYGWRVSPFSGKERMHLGLDIAAPLGSPIYATADGTVVRVASTSDYGRMLEIQHSNRLLTRYAHTSIMYVKEGQKVKKGEIIAAVGSTGRSTGPHVHYEIEVDRKRIDPQSYIVLW